MTVIRLDAATLQQVRSAGRVVLADEAGNPVGVYLLRREQPLDEEPTYSEEEWRAVMSSPVKYTTEQVIEMLRRKGG